MEEEEDGYSIPSGNSDAEELDPDRAAQQVLARARLGSSAGSSDGVALSGAVPVGAVAAPSGSGEVAPGPRHGGGGGSGNVGFSLTDAQRTSLAEAWLSKDQTSTVR